MTLYKECLEALGSDIIILETKEAEKDILSKFESALPITSWARIDWDNMSKYSRVSSVEEIIPLLKTYFQEDEIKDVYIIWDQALLPIIHADLFEVLKVIDDVTAVSFDTWLYSTKGQFVIEFYHENEITVGLIDQV